MEKYSIIAIAAIFITTSMIGGTTAFAGTPESNYQAGYNDGCADANSQTGAAFMGHSNAMHHSMQYVNGYNAGLAACAATHITNTNNVVTHTQNQAQYQNQNPNYSCFTLIGNCGAQNSAQDQGSSQ